jgi:hypothetical protein
MPIRFGPWPISPQWTPFAKNATNQILFLLTPSNRLLALLNDHDDLLLVELHVAYVARELK